MSELALVTTQALPLLVFLVFLWFSKASAPPDTGLMSLPMSAAKEEEKHVFMWVRCAKCWLTSVFSCLMFEIPLREKILCNNSPWHFLENGAMSF